MTDRKEIEAGILDAVWRLFCIVLGVGILAAMLLAAAGVFG